MNYPEPADNFLDRLWAVNETVGHLLMCLAIPGKILEIEEADPLLRTGRVQFGGIIKQVNLAYTPDAKIGDYVLVHVGFAISVIDEREARRVFDYIEEIGELPPVSEASPG